MRCCLGAAACTSVKAVAKIERHAYTSDPNMRWKDAVKPLHTAPTGNATPLSAPGVRHSLGCGGCRATVLMRRRTHTNGLRHKSTHPNTIVKMKPNATRSATARPSARNGWSMRGTACDILEACGHTSKHLMVCARVAVHAPACVRAWMPCERTRVCVCAMLPPAAPAGTG